MIATTRILIGLGVLAATSLVGGCTSVPNSTSPVEIRAASTSPHSGWEKRDFYVGGLHTWVAPEPTVVRSEIASADQSVDGLGHPTVVLVFDSEGAEKMTKLSNRRMSRPVAIVLDGKIIAATVIMKPVSETLVVNFGKQQDGRSLAAELAQRVNEQGGDDAGAR